MKALVFAVFLVAIATHINSAPQQAGTSSSNAGPSRDCGSFKAISHIPTVVDRIRQNSSPLKDMGGTAALYKSATSLTSITHICGASLFSDRYLLTAAHCVVRRDSSTISISLGREDLNENPNPGPDSYGIEEIFIHPSYNPSRDKYDDLAVLKTDRKVQYGPEIWPFCLPDRDIVLRDYSFVRIAGWGKLDPKHKADFIQTEFVHLVTNSRCETIWQQIAPELYKSTKKNDYPQGWTEQIRCAGRDGVDACEGDSGGPLTFVDTNGRQTLIGIISRGIGNCPKFPELPAFYTNTVNYLEWIYNVMDLPTTLGPSNAAQPSRPTGSGSQNTLFPSNCGQTFALTSSTRRARIIGGTEIRVGAYPWLVALGRTGQDGTFDVQCGGSLITARHVISAAQCFVRLHKPTHALLGEHDLTRDNDGARPERHLIQRFSLAEYDSNTNQDDIAVLTLDSDVTFNNRIQPICLPFPPKLRDKSYVGNHLDVLGWGRTDHRVRETSPVPLEAKVEVVSFDDCNKAYSTSLGLNITDRQLCAGKGGTDTCSGDSGGPIQYLDLQTDRYYLAGVTSFGYECGNRNYPGVYTRVSSYLNWIQLNAN